MTEKSSFLNIGRNKVLLNKRFFVILRVIVFIFWDTLYISCLDNLDRFLMSIMTKSEIYLFCFLTMSIEKLINFSLVRMFCFFKSIRLNGTPFITNYSNGYSCNQKFDFKLKIRKFPVTKDIGVWVTPTFYFWT